MGSRINRAHDAKARAREARAAMLQDRQAQDARIEEAVAAALLAMEDRAAALAQAEQEERTLASALQRLGRESVAVRDIMTMTGLGEKHVTRLLRTKLDADADAERPSGARGGGRSCRWLTRRCGCSRRRYGTPPSWPGTGPRCSRSPARTACGGLGRSQVGATVASTSAPSRRRDGALTAVRSGTCA